MSITECERFFTVPSTPRQRQYEAFRAYFVEKRPSAKVARDFGYSPSAFRVMCHGFRRERPEFFVSPKPGPKIQPKKSAAREIAIDLRKRNHSVYEISEILRERHGIALSSTAIGELLKAEGFAPLPRRLDEERPVGVRPTVEVASDARLFSLEPRRFISQCGGLFLFVADLVRLGLNTLADSCGLPGSKVIPAEHALRSCLALKLWGIERKSHVMALTSDEGLALFAGLNVIPKKSFLSEYSSRITHRENFALLSRWNQLFPSKSTPKDESFNLDFHSVPFYGKDPIIESHYVAMRSRRQPSVLVFLAQDEQNHAFCYSNADIRKGEERKEVLAFVEFFRKAHGRLPRHLVFDSQLTTHAHLAKLDELGVSFITLRRRSRAIIEEVKALPPSAWRTIELDVPTREYKTPRVFEQTIRLAKRRFRQLFVTDLGHDKPTVLITNQLAVPAHKLIERYARRMLIENALSDAVRFFHMNALSSVVGLKVDFDMALLVIASGLYRLLAKRMRGYSEAQARTIFHDLINIPADVTIDEKEIRVELHRRSHLPLILASDLADKPVAVPWWGGRALRITTYRGPQR